jgi:hypothetical protein
MMMDQYEEFHRLEHNEIYLNKNGPKVSVENSASFFRVKDKQEFLHKAGSNIG